MCRESKIGCWLALGFFAAVLLSFGVAATMFILVYPGDECLLFVSVRGEALIYGNPAGCNFIGYGHCVIISASLVLICYIYLFKGKKIREKKTFQDPSYSNRTLHGSVCLIPSNDESSVRFDRPVLGRLTYQETLAPILWSVFLGTACLITSLVSLSGYLVSCNELQYETRRQVLGRTTLGSPIRTINMYCWSLFRDVDFHNRFHFDHYEYSGQWHGQYRGYQHGRVHQFETKHEHLIGVAYALELSLSFTWLASMVWFAIVFMLIYCRRSQKQQNKQDIAESLEDARIYAESLNQNFPQTLTSSQATMVPMKPLASQDQISLISHASSSLKPHHHYQQIRQPGVSVTPVPSYVTTPGVATPVPTPMPVVTQQLVSQFNPQSQPVLSTSAQVTAPSNGHVQYVQLSNGLLVPVGSVSHPNLPASGYYQQQLPILPTHSRAQSPPSLLTADQLIQQQILQQQLLQQQQQLHLQEQQLIAMGANPRSQQVNTSNSEHAQESMEQDNHLQEDFDECPNTRKNQRKQIDLSKDAGFKCSKI